MIIFLTLISGSSSKITLSLIIFIFNFDVFFFDTAFIILSISLSSIIFIFDFGKIFTVNYIGCIDGQEYRICADETGTIFYPFIRIKLPAIN